MHLYAMCALPPFVLLQLHVPLTLPAHPLNPCGCWFHPPPFSLPPTPLTGVLSAVLRDGVAMINAFNSTTRGRAPEQLTAALKMLFAADPAAAFTSSSHHDISAINWLQLGAASAPLFRGVSGVGSMLGALASEAKARPARVVRQKRAAPEPEVRPLDGAEALAEAGEAHGLAQETQRVVTEMRRQLRAVGCASAVRLVLDHDSFAHTVENVFALSFLCK